MKQKVTHSVSICIVCLMAACGGNTATNASMVQVSDPMPFAQLDARADALLGLYGEAIEDTDFTSAGDVQMAGTAKMHGVVGIGGLQAATDIENFAAIGQIDIAVNFATDEIDGVAHDFYYIEDEGAYEGTLVFEADITRADDVTLAGDLSGTLTRGGTDRELHADMTGAFVGDDAAGLYASGTGRNTRSDGGTFDIGVQILAAD